MYCEFDYCIYNKNSICILKGIEIDLLGMCDQCIMVSISEESLNILKQKELESLEDIENK